MTNTRREFLRTALLSSAIVFIPFSPIKALAGSKLSTISNEDDLYKLALEARELFFKRQFDDSERIYLRIIELKSEEIAFYDGLKKVYAAQNKDLFAAELYRNGWLINKNNSMFCAKFANELANLGLGNKKQAAEFVEKYGVENILDESVALMNEALLYDQSNHFAKTVLKNTTESRNAFLEAKSKGHRKYKKKKSKRNSNYINLSENSISARIEKLKNKDRRTLYFDDEQECRDENLKIAEKKLHRALYKKSLRTKDHASAEQYALKIYDLDKNDTQTIGDLRKIYSQQKEYEKLVAFSREVLKNKDDFWSRVALAKSLRLAYESGRSEESINESISIYNSLKVRWGESNEKLDLTINDGLANCYRLKYEYQKALEIYQNLENTLNTNKRYIQNTICIGKAKVFMQQGNSEGAVQLIERQLSKNINTSYKPNRYKAKKKARNKEQINEETEDIVLYAYLAKVYNSKENKESGRYYYKKIHQLQPRDKNAEKLSKM